MKVKTPAVRMGRPEGISLSKYAQISVDHVVIWQLTDIEPDQVDGIIEITLIKFLLFKSLAVKGAREKISWKKSTAE